MTHARETDARILIDDQLRLAAWDPADKSQVLTEVRITRNLPFVAALVDGETTGSGGRDQADE